MSGAATKFAANYATKKLMGKEMDKYKHKKPAGSDDPYFEYVTAPNGKQKKVKKQIPDYIPEHDAKVLERVKSRAYHLDLCLFNFMGIRFGWSAIWGLIPELGDVVDLIFAVHLMRRCGKIEGGLPSGIYARMVLNVFIDFLVGLVPFIGDLADAAFRCNTKNAALLEEHLMKKYGPSNMSMKDKRSSRLESFSSDDKHMLRDTEKTPHGASTQPAGVQTGKSNHADRFNRDLEMGHQDSGTVRH